MIAEAIDTAVTLGWALAVWIVLLAFFASLALYTFVAIVWAAGRGIWRVLRGAWAAAAARTALYARLRTEVPKSAPRLPQARERRPTPRWAAPLADDPESRKPQEAA